MLVGYCVHNYINARELLLALEGNIYHVCTTLHIEALLQIIRYVAYGERIKAHID